MEKQKSYLELKVLTKNIIMGQFRKKMSKRGVNIILLTVRR